MYILRHQPPSLYTSCNHWWDLCNKEENFWTILHTKPFVLITPFQVGILLGWDINQTTGLKLSIRRHSSLNHLVVYLCTMDVFPYCFMKCLLIIPQNLLITFHLLKFFLITLCPGPDSDAASTVLWISAFSPSKMQIYVCVFNSLLHRGDFLFVYFFYFKHATRHFLECGGFLYGGVSLTPFLFSVFLIVRMWAKIIASCIDFCRCFAVTHGFFFTSFNIAHCAFGVIIVRRLLPERAATVQRFLHLNIIDLVEW